MEAVEGGNILIGVVAIVVALFVVLGLKPMLAARAKARVTVPDTHAGLLVRKGKVEHALQPGVYSTWLTQDRIELYDMRGQAMQVAGQEVLTRDLLPVKLTLIARYRILDAQTFRASDASPLTRVYEDIQISLRQRVASQTLDELLADRESVAAGFADALKATAARMGMEISDIAVRDLTLAGPARQAFADIWRAQKEGQAALERARGEQAALRSLANAARMLKGNPELMNLRLLQALSGQAGKTPPTLVLSQTGLMPVSSGAEPGAAEG